MTPRSFLKYWLPVVAWMIFIFIGSTDLMSAEHTSRFIVPFLLWLKPDMSPETIARIHMLIRKLGHVTDAEFWRRSRGERFVRGFFAARINEAGDDRVADFGKLCRA
jgi:hypothetical protein